ncbi:MAG: DNA repair protein RecO [Gammaproteobacteria bacterium]|nr:DNA repair protein RecO [Gammaproteobacteria bacterium]MBT8151073.1 DNA repair protein RecO [Gammaproteobacteria bacterium]NND37959.1 DNA repair protein RecO [Pseudomonadales bacterium]NNM11827.1 DNA repair protein RecO [Pseudomonadales bacterium]
MASVEQTRVFVLHQRPYRETSAIVDFISEHHGRLSVVCKGLRGQGKAGMGLRANLQPFAELSLGFAGRSELKSLRSIEALQAAPRMSRDTLYAALYMNELLLRLGRANEFCQDIYSHYRNTLQELCGLDALGRQAGTASDGERSARSHNVEVALRKFEFALIEIMGFALNFEYTCDTHEPIVSAQYYSYFAGHGFQRKQNAAHGEVFSPSQVAEQTQALVASGEILALLATGDFEKPEARKFAKRLTRAALHPLLGERPMKTRELYA